MPKFEKLDNDRKRTGIIKEFNFREAARLRRAKNCHWVEIEGPKPKISREKPIEATEQNKKLVSDFPQKKGEQLDWVRKCDDVEMLEAAKHLAQAYTVVNAINSKIMELKNSNQ